MACNCFLSVQLETTTQIVLICFPGVIYDFVCLNLLLVPLCEGLVVISVFLLARAGTRLTVRQLEYIISDILIFVGFFLGGF